MNETQSETVKPISLAYKDKEITLIPTAHISKESAALTAQIIDEIKPDTICIELDEDRYKSISNPQNYRNTDISKVIKEHKTGFLLVNLILSNYQKKLAAQLGSTSGQEMKVGIEKAKELNANLVLADRRLQTTFSRIWANMNFIDKIKMLSMLVSAASDDEQISEEDLRNLQQTDMLQAALKDVSQAFPKITDVLVVERDKYLAYKIKTAPGTKIVAILGAAHTIGIQQYLNEDYDIAPLDEIPPKKLSSKIIRWIIPVILIAAIIACFSINPDLGWNSLKSWILINGTLSALGALAAGAHPLSILVAFVAAPITSLNPLLASGWFAGLTEAALRKPKVEDFDNLAVDLNSFKGFLRNRVTKILLIVIFSNIGSSIGSFVSGIGIIRSLFD